MNVLADLNARYTDTAFRLEVRQQYAGGQHEPRTILTDPYLRRVAEHTLAGKRRDRVHVVALPLSDYMRYELGAYRENVTVGERVLIARLTVDTARLGPDVWLFDEDTDHPEAMLMHYDDAGSIREREHVTDRCRLDGLISEAKLARSLAVDLDRFVASLDVGEQRAG